MVSDATTDASGASARVSPIDRARRFWLSDGAACAFVCCVIFLTLFRAVWALNPALRTQDEGCYMEYVGDLLGMDTSNVCLKDRNYFAPGASLAWLPAGLVGRVLALFGDVNAIEVAAHVIALYSFGLLGVCIYLVSRLLRRQGLGGIGWATLVVLNAPILYYAIQRPLFAHTVELAAALGLVLALLSDRLGWALGLGILVTLTRYNDIPALLLLPARMLDLSGGRFSALVKSIPSRLRIALPLALVSAFAAVAYIAFIKGYNNFPMQRIFRDFSWRWTRTFLYGSDWGMIWTGTWWLGALAAGLAMLPWSSWLSRAALLWMAVEGFVAISWAGNGGDFGYRYLIGSYAAALVIWLELLGKLPRPATAAFKALTAAGASVLTYLTIVYRTIPNILGPNPDPVLCLTGTPNFLVNAVDHLANPKVWQVVTNQLPLVVLYNSWTRPETTRPGEAWILYGSSVLLFSGAVAATLLFAALYVMRRLRYAADTSDR